MAKRYFSIVAAGLLSAVTGIGCQTNNPNSSATGYPAPSFDSPKLMAQTVRPAYATVAPPPVPKYVTPVMARPTQIASAGVPHIAASILGPASWVPPVPARPWRWIIIHHSATATGGAAAFDKEHRAKGWDELGYDFVIGNGTDTGLGQVEVGPRWVKQKIGAHAKTPDNRYNEYGIGICLVGNYDVDHPSAKQLEALNKLVSYLMVTYHIPPDHILGHGMTKNTDCPGKNVSIADIRRRAAVSAGVKSGTMTASANGEMLTDVSKLK